MAKKTKVTRAAVALAAAAAVLGMSSCSFKEVQEREISVNVPPKAVFLGDSIAAGYGLEGYTDTDNYSCMSYANILKEGYEAELKDKCGHVMVNEAVSGDTSQQLLDHISKGEFDSALSDSDVVVISIGGNDILEIFLDYLSDNIDFSGGSISLGDIDVFSLIGGFGDMEDKVDTALEGFEENLKEIIIQVRARTDGDIYVQTLYDPLEYFDFDMLTKFADGKIERLNEIVKNNAGYGEGAYYTVVDLAPDFDGRCGELTNIPSYDIHPNADGHKLIAEDLDRAIRSRTYSYSESYEVTDKKKVIAAAAGVLGGLIALIAGAAIVLESRKKGRNA